MHSSHWSRRVPLALLMVVPSSVSRSSSPSHHITKLIWLGLPEPTTTLVVALRNAGSADDQNSAPGLLASTSAATPRPLSALVDVDWNKISQFSALRRCHQGLALSS